MSPVPVGAPEDYSLVFGWPLEQAATRSAFVGEGAGMLEVVEIPASLRGTVAPGVRFLAVANRYQPAVPSLEQFLTMQGRRKFVRPLIEALAKDSQWGRPIAARIYARARAGYHPITTRDLDKLGLGAG